MAPGDIVDLVLKIASVWSNQLSEYPNSVGASRDAYSCCMTQGRGRQIVSEMFVVGVSIVLCSVSGCITVESGFDSPAPSKRIDAIVDASALEDNESLLKLVEKLRSFDPAERMFAIRSLEIRTGETLGYDHAAHNWQRIEAFGRWVEYLDEQGIETSSIVDEDMDMPTEQDAG